MAKHVLLAAHAWTHQIAIDRLFVTDPVRFVGDDDIRLAGPFSPPAVTELRIEKARTRNQYLDPANSFPMAQLFGELRITCCALCLPGVMPSAQRVNDCLNVAVRELAHVRVEVVRTGAA